MGFISEPLNKAGGLDGVQNSKVALLEGSLETDRVFVGLEIGFLGHVGFLKPGNQLFNGVRLKILRRLNGLQAIIEALHYRLQQPLLLDGQETSLDSQHAARIDDREILGGMSNGPTNIGFQVESTVELDHCLVDLADELRRFLLYKAVDVVLEGSSVLLFAILP